MLIKSTDVKPTDDLQRQLTKQKAENEQQKIELDKLRQALLERDAIIEEQDKRLLVDHETQAIQTVGFPSYSNAFSSLTSRMKINHLFKYSLNQTWIRSRNYKQN